MVTEVTLYHPGLQVVLHCGDAVDFHEDVYVKEVSVENIASYKREVRLFFSLDLGISGNDIGDQAVIIKFWVNFAATIDSEARAKELGVMKLMRDLGLLR
jgi:hypothetical protein